MKYKIVRHKFQGESKTIERGLTLEEAQEWCSRDDTSGDGWFDGYTEDERMTKARRFDKILQP